jgi:hypothetical protein
VVQFTSKPVPVEKTASVKILSLKIQPTGKNLPNLLIKTTFCIYVTAFDLDFSCKFLLNLHLKLSCQ